METYRHVLLMGDGPAVLADILYDLHFFDAFVESEEEVALNNYARKLLVKLGIWRAEHIDQIVGELSKILPKEEK